MWLDSLSAYRLYKRLFVEFPTGLTYSNLY